MNIWIFCFFVLLITMLPTDAHSGAYLILPVKSYKFPQGRKWSPGSVDDIPIDARKLTKNRPENDVWRYPTDGIYKDPDSDMTKKRPLAPEGEPPDRLPFLDDDLDKNGVKFGRWKNRLPKIKDRKPCNCKFKINSRTNQLELRIRGYVRQPVRKIFPFAGVPPRRLIDDDDQPIRKKVKPKIRTTTSSPLLTTSEQLVSSTTHFPTITAEHILKPIPRQINRNSSKRT